MKIKKQTGKKALLICVCCLLCVGICFSCISWFYYDRSIMASLAEMYMIAVDRDDIYEQGPGYVKNLRVRATENLQDYEIPSSVSMDVSVYDKHEHGMQTFYVNEETFSDTIIVYIPGGGYLNNPLKYHWRLINNVTQQTNCPVIVPIYLKVPNYTCEESVAKMLEFYEDLATRDGVEHIIFMGDSTTYGYVTIGMSTNQIWTPDSHTMSIYEQSFVYVDTTKGPMQIRAAAAEHQPDLMVITLGIRHITTMKEMEFKAEYTDLVNGILEASPNTKIILNSVYPVADFLDPRELAVTNDMIDTVNGWIQYVVEQTGVRYLDSNSILKGEDGYMVRSYARSDGLHLAPDALNLVLENIRTHAYQ